MTQVLFAHMNNKRKKINGLPFLWPSFFFSTVILWANLEVVEKRDVLKK
jgi:hypothetical protein